MIIIFIAESELWVKIYNQDNSQILLQKLINLVNQGLILYLNCLDVVSSENSIVQIDDRSFPEILICITSSVIKINWLTMTSIFIGKIYKYFITYKSFLMQYVVIGKQSLGMVLGATI